MTCYVKIVSTYRRHLHYSLDSDREDGYYPTVYSDRSAELATSRQNSEMKFAVYFAVSVHILFSIIWDTV